MSKKHNPPSIEYRPNLVEVMNRMGFDAEELIEYADIMGYNQDGELDDLDKEHIISRLSEEILADPRTVLERLPFEDLVVLQMMKDMPPEGYYGIVRTNLFVAMAQIGLAIQVENDEERPQKDIIIVADDFLKACLPIIDEVVESEQTRVRTTMERLLTGLINIYGALPEVKLWDLLKENFIKEEEDLDMVEEMMSDSIALYLMENYSHEKGAYYYLSPFSTGLDDVLYDIDNRPDIKTFKKFNGDAIAKAGDLPEPILPNPYNDQIVEVLEKKLGYSSKDALSMRLVMWQDVQEDDMAIGKIMQKIIDQSPQKGVSNGIEILNSVIQDISNFLNHTPRWKFKGHCPADLAIIGAETPRVVLGPNARRSGINQAHVQRMVDQMWASRKVGRNDPCPCGSGKKYKNCCGKNL